MFRKIEIESLLFLSLLVLTFAGTVGAGAGLLNHAEHFRQLASVAKLR